MKLKGFYFSLICSFLCINATAQETKKDYDPVLFTVEDQTVRLSEFEYVYNKNNQNDKDSYTQESLETYLNLYVNFRLKVKQAEEMGLDTLQNLKKELEGYRKQLSKSYLYDREVTDKLIKEAYERKKQEVRASHILINIANDAVPSDTLKAYKEALRIKKELDRGKDFETLAKKYSSDPSVSENGGDIGYFTVFETVYAFESAAYNTPVGEISDPVRTRFGYHILKVTDKRPAQGKIKVAHILIKVPENPSEQQKAFSKSRIEEVYKHLEAGADFKQMVKVYSEDRFSKKTNGEIPVFGTGKMVEAFETAAFSLKEDGDYSKPIKTDYGWHIIQRISKDTIPPFNEIKDQLRKRVERDTRSQIAKNTLVERIKEEYNFKTYPKNKEEIFERIGGTILMGPYKMENKENLDKPLFSLAGTNFTQKDFVEFLESRQKRKRRERAEKLLQEYYNQFEQESCFNYEEAQLDRKYVDFRNLMKEYRDGILLFELTDKKVWSKAVKDTVGLKNFHEANKNNYMWSERVHASTFISKDEKTAKKAHKLAAKGKKSVQEIVKKLNKKETLLEVESDIYQRGDDSRVDAMEWTEGVNELKSNENGQFYFIKINEVIPAQPKTLNEARGYIISDYQEHLEKEWIKDLREKYTVEINREVIKPLIKQ
ncbi:MAG: peptidylprolyl isomerase [Chitinophagales bacterium]